MKGRFFHSFNNGEFKWQGRIEARPRHGVYLVQLLSWMNGGPTDQVLVPLEEMKDWRFYADGREMREAYEVWCDQRGIGERHPALQF